MNIKSVSINKGSCQECSGHPETDVTQIGCRCKCRIAKFVNIEGKLRSNMAVRTLVVGHTTSELTLELWKFNRGCRIDRLQVADGIAQVVRQSPHRKRVFIDGVGIPKQPCDEVTAAYVMRQIAEKLFAERIVPHILDGTSAIGIRMCLDQLS